MKRNCKNIVATVLCVAMIICSINPKMLSFAETGFDRNEIATNSDAVDDKSIFVDNDRDDEKETSKSDEILDTDIELDFGDDLGDEVDFENDLGEIERATSSDAIQERITHMPKFQYSNVIDGYAIQISAEEGVFPEDTEVVIKKIETVSGESAKNLINEKISDDETICSIVTFDISFVLDQEEIQPDNGKVQISIGLVDNINIDEHSVARVYHIEDRNSIEEIACESFEGNVVKYQADSFSAYTIAIISNEAVAISTVDEFINMEDDGNYILVSDLDFSNIDDYHRNKFSGKFNGNGHIISNLHINSMTRYAIGLFGVGLFGELSGSVKNLTLDKCSVEIDETSCDGQVEAGFICANIAYGSIDNCKVSNSIEKISLGDETLAFVGGIAGATSGLSTQNISITKCRFDGRIETVISHGFGWVGGIIGGNHTAIGQELIIDRCENRGEIYSCCYDTKAGGICGTYVSLDNDCISQCINRGNISLDENVRQGSVGGIVGSTSGDYINDCFNIGGIYVKNAYIHVGGILGEVLRNTYNLPTSISNVYNIGDIDISGETLEEYLNVGGIVGAYPVDVRKIKNDYCLADLKVKYPYGSYDGNDKLDNMLTAIEMSQQSSFKGFDFVSVWKMGEGDYPYPVLQWQDAEYDIPNIPDRGEEPDIPNTSDKEDGYPNNYGSSSGSHHKVKHESGSDTNSSDRWKVDSNGTWSCLDENGNKITGYKTLEYKGKKDRYLFDENGNMLTGWQYPYDDGDIRYFKETSPQTGSELTLADMKVMAKKTSMKDIIDSYDYYDEFVDSLSTDDMINLFGGNWGAFKYMFGAVDGFQFDREHLISYLEQDIQTDKTLKSAFLCDVMDQICESRTIDYSGGINALKKACDKIFGGNKVTDIVWENLSDVAPALNGYINDYQKNIYYLETVKEQAKYQPELVDLIDQIISEYRKTYYDKMDETHIAQTIQELQKNEVRTMNVDYLVKNYGLNAVMRSPIISNGFGLFAKIVRATPWVSTVQKVIATQAVIDQMEQTMCDNEVRLTSAGIISGQELRDYEVNFNILKEMYEIQYDNMIAFYTSQARFSDVRRLKAYKVAVEEQIFYNREVLPTMDEKTINEYLSKGRFRAGEGNGGGAGGGQGF